MDVERKLYLIYCIHEGILMVASFFSLKDRILSVTFAFVIENKKKIYEE